MQTLTLQIPDSQFPLILAEIKKYKDVKIEFSSKEDVVRLSDEIKQAVKEINLVKKSLMKARPARELLNEL
ncbi:MAG: hypothetical protein KIT33_02620 [Candidatus Kapabacteria bacterium]|nr:hypothetical protein [Ignavibacteriota bacterium]MCW5883843.1 hypothetical protein [Candidatus Kapabacteria bacterium]